VDKVVALRIGWADPADLLDEPGALIRLAAAVGGEEPMARIEADRRLLAWLRADQRFLRSALPAMLVCDGAVLRSEADPEPLPPEVCRALLVPPPPAARPTSSDWEPSARVHEVADAAQRVLERRTPRTVQGEWARRAPHLREALAGRRYVLGVEQGEREEVAALAVGSLRRELADLRDAGAERGLVTRKTNQLLAEEARMLYLAQTHEARLGWLDGVEERLVRPSLHLFRIALVRVQGLRGE